MIQWWQIAALTLYAAYQILDELTIVSSAGSPVFAGFMAGLIMGDLKTGLLIGGSLQLTVLGVGTFGGATRIDMNSGAVLATAFAVALKMPSELAISTIAVPVAVLLTQADIAGRFATTFFAHRIDKHIEAFNYKGIERNYLLGAIPWALSRALPVFLALAFGGEAVKSTVDFLNTNAEWLVKGLTVAGGALPGVGFAILLRYLPVKKHFPYLIAGFTITALLTTVFSNISALGSGVANVFGKIGAAGLGEDVVKAVESFSGSFNGLPILAVSLIGFALASLHFKQEIAIKPTVVQSVSEGEIEDDEL